MVWRFAVPTRERIVHVEQKWIHYDAWAPNARDLRPKRIMEDENGNKIALDVGVDDDTRLKQGQLERFGFTSSQSTPILDDHELFTGPDYFHDYFHDRWLYSACHSDVENLAQTCSESRAAVEERYELTFSNRFGPARIWFNFETDILYLGCNRFFYGHRPGLESPFNLSMFCLKDLHKLKQLAVQYPRYYCMENEHLEEVVKCAANLDHLYLVEGDSSEFDRSDLEFIQFEYAATGRQYISRSWDDLERVEKYVEGLQTVEDVYDSWIENVEQNLAEFYDRCKDNGESSFSIPTLELVSVMSRKDYDVLSRLVLEVEETYEMRQVIRAKARSLQHKTWANWEQYRIDELHSGRASSRTEEMLLEAWKSDPDFDAHFAAWEKDNGIASSSLEEMLLEAWEFDREMSLDAQFTAWKKETEDSRMLSLYEAELEYEEQQGEFQGRSEEYWEAKERASQKAKMGSILGYFKYIGESETAACWTSSMIGSAAEDEKAIRDEEEREAEQAALAEHLQYEHSYEPDLYPN